MTTHTDIHDDRLNINIDGGYLWLECVESNNYTYLAFTLEQAEAILKDLNDHLMTLRGTIDDDDVEVIENPDPAKLPRAEVDKLNIWCNNIFRRINNLEGTKERLDSVSGRMDKLKSDVDGLCSNGFAMSKHITNLIERISLLESKTPPPWWPSIIT